jgi:sterol 3beta-glucosyltransferase
MAPTLLAHLLRRSDLGLPPMRYGVMSALTAMGKDVPIVVACSRLFIPGQKTPSDWLPSARVTGFPFVPATRADTVDLALSAFVERSTHAGGAPIYCGFGSMPAPEPRALVDLAIQVRRLACMDGDG